MVGDRDGRAPVTERGFPNLTIRFRAYLRKMTRSTGVCFL
jgi:hypothetical protein